MQKINIDFGLGLDNYNVDYNKLNYIKSVQNEKKKKKRELTKKYCELCDNKLKLEKVIDIFNKKIKIQKQKLNKYSKLGNNGKLNFKL